MNGWLIVLENIAPLKLTREIACDNGGLVGGRTGGSRVPNIKNENLFTSINTGAGSGGPGGAGSSGGGTVVVVRKRYTRADMYSSSLRAKRR